MSAADKLAQVIREELVGTVGECVCDEAFTSRNLEDPQCAWHNTDGDNLPAELAAVVLAHLTAEGWAQGKPEYAVSGSIMHPVLSYDHGAATTLHTKHGMPIVRRYVTEWEPVETGDQK